MSINYQYKDGCRSELKSLIPYSIKPIKVLEIGCGNGHFRKNFPEDCEYWGIDPHPGVALAASRVMSKMIIGTYDQVKDDLPENYFDCVVCNDVIEHMPDENLFLQTIKLKMAESGVLIGSIPNVRYVTNLIRLLVKKDWAYVSTGILDKTHLRFFTKKSIMAMFVRNELLLLELNGINRMKLEGTSPVKICKYLALCFAVLVFGLDSRYTQFAFRVRKGFPG